MIGRVEAGRHDTDRWRSLAEISAPIIKRLVVEGGFRGTISKRTASRIIGSRWLRGA